MHRSATRSFKYDGRDARRSIDSDIAGGGFGFCPFVFATLRAFVHPMDMGRRAKILAAVFLVIVVVPFIVGASLLAETVPAACHLNHHSQPQPMNHACCAVNRPSSFLPGVISHAQDVLFVAIAFAPEYFVSPIRSCIDSAEKFPDSSPPLISPLRI